MSHRAVPAVSPNHRHPKTVPESPLRTASWIACACLAGAVAAGPAGAGDPPQESAAAPADPYRIDKDRLIFTSVRDDAPFPTDGTNQAEYEAYATVLLHARQFPTADLERHARRDVTFRDLYLPVRRDYRLDLIYFEGRLKQLRRTEPTAALKEAGVKDLYEGWLFPRDEWNPVCVVVTELPPGLEPQKDLKADEMNRWVGFAGYSFKLLQYESRQADPKNPGRNVFRRAPVLLGRSVTPLAETQTGSDDPWVSTFLPAVVAGFGGVAVLILVLTWYFRRGDRVVRAAVDARHERNPFAD